MELPEFTTAYEKLGILGSMLFLVFGLLFQQLRNDPGHKVTTADSLSQTLAAMKEDIARVEAKGDARATKCDETQRQLDRIIHQARDLELWRERMIVMWDRHQERVAIDRERHRDRWRDERE